MRQLGNKIGRKVHGGAYAAGEEFTERVPCTEGRANRSYGLLLATRVPESDRVAGEPKHSAQLPSVAILSVL